MSVLDESGSAFWVKSSRNQSWKLILGLRHHCPQLQPVILLPLGLEAHTHFHAVACGVELAMLGPQLGASGSLLIH